MRRSTHRIGRCTFQLCRRAIGHQLWMHDHQLNLKEVPLASRRILEARMLVGRRVLPRCRRKPEGRGQRQMSRTGRRGRRRVLSPCKSGDISLGGDQTTRTRSAMMSEWSDDDEVTVAPPPSTEAPPRNTCAEDPSCSVEDLSELHRHKTSRTQRSFTFEWSGHHQARCCLI